MAKRQIALVLGLIVLACLLTGVASGASTQLALADQLTETYTWSAYNVAIQYPAGWKIVEGTGAISFYPASYDVSDQRGPELVLFHLADTSKNPLEVTLKTLANSSGATHRAIKAGSIEGHPARITTLDWTAPSATGKIVVIGVGEQEVLGAAYVVRSTDTLTFLPTLEAMLDSLTFDVVVSAPARESSVSVTSVQLTQPYVLDEAGLVMYFPENWDIESEWEDDVNIVTVYSPLSSRQLYQIGVMAVFEVNHINLHTIATAVTSDETVIGDFIDVTVAGYSGLTYVVVVEDDNLLVHRRDVILHLDDQDAFIVLNFIAEEPDWEDFRPTVSAMLSSIKLLDNQSAAYSDGAIHVRAVLVHPQLMLQNNP